MPPDLVCTSFCSAFAEKIFFLFKASLPLLFKLYLILLLVTCPYGFDVYHDSCYKFFVNETEHETLDNANVTCKILTNDTGRVVRVDSYDEQFFLNWGLKDRAVDRGDRVFVGHTYDSSSSTMLYYGSSGSGPSSSEWPDGDWWASRYPRNVASKECVALVYDYPSQEWLFGDVFCSDQYGFICEIPQSKYFHSLLLFLSSFDVTCAREGEKQILPLK